MSNFLSYYTTYLANRLCGGSSRKLIAGWWYSILGLTVLLMVLSFAVMGTRPFSEGFASFWSDGMLCILSIGGTMIMRKFHNSMAVGFFMGGVVSMSQMFFVLFLLYLGYAKDQHSMNMSTKEETLMAFIALLQSILLGSFAAILAAHRSEILDQPGGGGGGGGTSGGGRHNNNNDDDDTTTDHPDDDDDEDDDRRRPRGGGGITGGGGRAGRGGGLARTSSSQDNHSYGTPTKD